MKFASEKSVAALAFVGALGASFAALPLLLGGPAFALDAKGPEASEFRPPLPSERVEARIAYAKTALRITDAQAKLWAPVADFMRREAHERDAMIQQFEAKRGEREKISAIDRLKHHQEMMQKASAKLGEFIAVVQPLYASFSDEQKRTADELLMRAHMRGGMGHFHHMGGRMGPPHEAPPTPGRP